MDKYIATALTIIFMVIFIPQNAIQTTNHLTIAKCESIIEVAKEAAKHEGYFTQTIIDDMNDSFEDLGIEVSSIEEDLTTTIKYRPNTYATTEFITYKIGIPITEIVAAPALFGISEADNSYVYYFKGKFPSERVVR